MTLFYKIVNECTPEYLRAPTNQARVKPYSFRNRNVLEPINSRTNRFTSSFYPFCVREWNNLESSLRVLPSICQFKTAIIRIIRPLKRSIYHLSGIPGCKLLTRLRLEFSELREHKFQHNFNCIDPMCLCGTGVEDNEHFLLHSQRFFIHRTSYLDNVSQLTNRSTTTLLIV